MLYPPMGWEWGFLHNHDHTSLLKPLPRLPTSPIHSHTRPHLPTTTPNYSHTQPGPHTGIVPPSCQRFLKPAAPQIIKPTMTHYPTYSVSVHYFRYVLSNVAAGCPIHQGHLQVLVCGVYTQHVQDTYFVIPTPQTNTLLPPLQEVAISLVIPRFFTYSPKVQATTSASWGVQGTNVQALYKYTRVESDFNIRYTNLYIL